MREVVERNRIEARRKLADAGQPPHSDHVGAQDVIERTMQAVEVRTDVTRYCSSRSRLAMPYTRRFAHALCSAIIRKCDFMGMRPLLLLAGFQLRGYQH